MDYKDCKSEQDFKKKYIRKELERRYMHVFCIETEETEEGFPDVLCIAEDGKTSLFEFKVSGASGKVRFRPSQISFYKRHPRLNIIVVALDRRSGEAAALPVHNLYFEQGKPEVQL